MKIKLKTHSFSVAVAEEVGLLPAVILHNIFHWVDYNEKNGINYYDGHYWTYNSAKAFQEQFTYASVMQIRTAIEKLKDAGFILTANYNKAPFDRTLWYTVTDKAILIMSGGDISNNPTINNTPSNSDKEDKTEKEEKYKDEIKEIIDYLNERADCRYRYNSEGNNKLIRARLNEGYSVDDFKRVIDNKVSDWMGTDWQKFIRPATLFSTGHFDQYLNQKNYVSPQNQVSSQNQVSREEFERLKETTKAY